MRHSLARGHRAAQQPKDEIMRKKLGWIWRVPAVTALVAAGAFAAALAAGIQTDPPDGRTDALEIRPVQGNGKMPAVRFLHDLHTDSAALKGKGCDICHPSEGKRAVFRFKSVKDLSPKESQELFHNACVACHDQARARGEKSGPGAGDCRTCHDAKAEKATAWTPVRLDRSLHFRHESATSIMPLDFKEQGGSHCSACHHEYDSKAGKTFYAQGKEGSCAYCHKDTVSKDPEAGNARTGRDASHSACVNCHLSLAAQKEEAGPARCEGCHSAASQAKYEKAADTPRMKRNQPDTALMAEWFVQWKKTGEKKESMGAVAFNHKAHEAKTGSCRDCHHAALSGCRECHTLTGDIKGGNIRLGEAMHAGGKTQSCVGCHAGHTKDKNCSGCHAAMGERPFADTDCKGCHGVSLDGLEAPAATDEALAALARAGADARPVTAATLAPEDIPETVTIGAIAKEYEPAKFPHRKVVLALVKKTEGSRMAAVFHKEAVTLCAGCHHQSPATAKPPRCASCHGAPFAGPEKDRPGLKGAYHGQCIGCHESMGVLKPAATACAECHAKRK
jgi:hypothetical protein